MGMKVILSARVNQLLSNIKKFQERKMRFMEVVSSRRGRSKRHDLPISSISRHEYSKQILLHGQIFDIILFVSVRFNTQIKKNLKEYVIEKVLRNYDNPHTTYTHVESVFTFLLIYMLVVTNRAITHIP